MNSAMSNADMAGRLPQSDMRDGRYSSPLPDIRSVQATRSVRGKVSRQPVTSFIPLVLLVPRDT